jgi:hypothetical protein
MIKGKNFGQKVQLIVRYLPHQIGYSNFKFKTADNSKNNLSFRAKIT